jgi:hypothetical protein
MPPPSEQSQPDFDEVRRKADEFARHAYPDVFARFERIRSGLDVNLPIVSAIIKREHQGEKKFSSRPAGNLFMIRSIQGHSKFRLVGCTSMKMSMTRSSGKSWKKRAYG